jgi:hypothetical protein
MDPFSRKLFTTRDAREHLRSMGGILSSSPRLAETVAKFQVGGNVIAPVVGASQEPALVVFSGSNFAVFPDGRVVNTDANVEVDDTQDPGGDLRRVIQSIASGELAAVGVPPEAAATATPEELLGILDFEDVTEPMRERFAETVPPYEATAPSNVETFVAETFFPSRAAEMRAREAEAGREPPAVAQQRPAAVEAPLEEVPEVERVPSPETEEPPPAEPARPETPASSLSGTGAALATGDFDTSYEQMLARLESVMGDRDEDSRKKAMANLAMIGLAIAAGQSPDALTNIAQGALVGMKGIQEAEAAEKAQEREMRLAALRLAADEVSLTRRLQSEERIAGMRAAGGTGTYTPERLYQQNLSAILSNPDMFDVFEGDTVDPTRARLLAEQLSERGMSLGTADQQFVPGQIVVQDGVTFEYQQDGTWKRVGG